MEKQIEDNYKKPDRNFNLFLFVTFWGFFNAFIPLIVNSVINWPIVDQPVVNLIQLQILFIFLNETRMEWSLRRQIRDLKTELSDINMTDEFAKYAKIQRKINKAKDQLKNQCMCGLR